MENAVRVFEILLAVSNQNVERTELNKLIELTQSFAYTNLKFRYRKLANVLMVEDLTLNEMAIDAIASLFELNNDGTLIRIKSAFDRWEPAINNEETALFFLSRMASKSTEKYVSELLKESDPFFSKILHSLNYLVEKQGYLKKNILGTRYIIENEPVNAGLLPDNQFIFDLKLQLFRNPDCMLKNIFDHIKHNSDKQAAIPINALVLKIKKTHSLYFEVNDREENNNTIEIDTMINNAIQMTFKKLEDGYLSKNKLNEDESSAIRKALYRITVDLKDGGINTGLHKYLQEELPALSFDNYQIKYQNIFEYLFKVLKKEIAKQFEYEK